MAQAEAEGARLRQAQLRRAVIAGAIGATIECYDFFLYGVVASLVFARLYFPTSNALAGQINSFGIYAAGFAARPIGAALFGHFGDRIGRKSMLVATLLLMGTATFLVALVPSYQSIGLWGAVILTVLRFLQGVGVGGEWGGSVLLSMEWAQSAKNRGFIAAWPQFGVPAGLFLANLAERAASAWSGDQFMTWGWRIPFFLSAVLVALGLYIRLGIVETPVFRRLAAEQRLERLPVVGALKKQWREILLSACARLAEMTPFYIFTVYVLSYGTNNLHLSRDFLLNAVLAAAVLSLISVPFFGHLSDRIGRQKMYLIGAMVTGTFGYVYFALLDTTRPAAVFIAIALSLVPHAMLHGPQAALIAENFTGRLRYSGASLGYQLASLIAGGPAPLIATWLFSLYHSGYAIAAYIMACATASMIAVSRLEDYTGKDISEEYDEGV